MAEGEETGGSAEVVRASVVDGGLEVQLQTAFDDPAVWGILLADIARHAARAYAAENVCSEDEALEAIKNMFDAEWENPTERGTSSMQQ